MQLASGAHVACARWGELLWSEIRRGTRGAAHMASQVASPSSASSSRSAACTTCTRGLRFAQAVALCVLAEPPRAVAECRAPCVIGVARPCEKLVSCYVCTLRMRCLLRRGERSSKQMAQAHPDDVIGWVRRRFHFAMRPARDTHAMRTLLNRGAERLAATWRLRFKSSQISSFVCTLKPPARRKASSKWQADDDRLAQRMTARLQCSCAARGRAAFRTGHRTRPKTPPSSSCCPPQDHN